MVSFAMHLLWTGAVTSVSIHPDGELGKQFDFNGWLSRRGFNLISRTGKTAYDGVYSAANKQTIIGTPSPTWETLLQTKAER